MGSLRDALLNAKQLTFPSFMSQRCRNSLIIIPRFNQHSNEFFSPTRNEHLQCGLSAYHMAISRSEINYSAGLYWLNISVSIYSERNWFVYLKNIFMFHSWAHNCQLELISLSPCENKLVRLLKIAISDKRFHRTFLFGRSFTSFGTHSCCRQRI